MERSYADSADGATDFDPEMQFEKDIEKRDSIMPIHDELVSGIKDRLIARQQQDADKYEARIDELEAQLFAARQALLTEGMTVNDLQAQLASAREALEIVRTMIKEEMIEGAIIDTQTMQSLGNMLDTVLQKAKS